MWHILHLCAWYNDIRYLYTVLKQVTGFLFNWNGDPDNLKMTNPSQLQSQSCRLMVKIRPPIGRLFTNGDHRWLFGVRVFHSISIKKIYDLWCIHNSNDIIQMLILWYCRCTRSNKNWTFISLRTEKRFRDIVHYLQDQAKQRQASQSIHGKWIYKSKINTKRLHSWPKTTMNMVYILV